MIVVAMIGILIFRRVAINEIEVYSSCALFHIWGILGSLFIRTYFKLFKKKLLALQLFFKKLIINVARKIQSRVNYGFGYFHGRIREAWLLITDKVPKGGQ